MNPLYTRFTEEADGSSLMTQWGYCRSQNSVRLGYAVNILAALIGLVLLARGYANGVVIASLVGASFGSAYFAEQMRPGALRGLAVGASIAFTVCAYIAALGFAFGAQ